MADEPIRANADKKYGAAAVSPASPGCDLQALRPNPSDTLESGGRREKVAYLAHRAAMGRKPLFRNEAV